MTDSIQSPPDEWKRTTCVCTSVRRVDRALSRLYDDALRPSGLATTQYALLSMLARAARPVPHGELAEAQVMSGTTLTRNLAPLVRDGLVRIDSGDDRRTHLISITEKGLAARDLARPLWQEAQALLRGYAGDERIDHLLAELSDLVTRIR